MNIFYCNGSVSVIIASSLINKSFSGQKNVLLMEIDDVKVFPAKAVSYPNEYHLITDTIARSSGWDKVIKIRLKTLFISIENAIWPLPKLPIQCLRVLLNKREALQNISDLMPPLTDNDRFIVSDNSSLWRHFINQRCDFSFVEHGAASYKSRSIEKNWKYRVKSAYAKFIGVDLNMTADSIYLSDQNMSSRVGFYNEASIGCKPLSVDLVENIQDLFTGFIHIYENENTEAYKELREMKDIYGSIYLYMPTALVPDSEYHDYLHSQIRQIKEIDINSVFLIKAHGNDGTRDYSRYFSDLGLPSVSFNSTSNKYIPAEILLFYFDNAIAFGSYSSTHLYSRWWLNKKSIFAEVENCSIQEILVREYKAVYDDFQSFKL
jgi:hypothetical protein